MRATVNVNINQDFADDDWTTSTFWGRITRVVVLDDGQFPVMQGRTGKGYGTHCDLRPTYIRETLEVSNKGLETYEVRISGPKQTMRGTDFANLIAMKVWHTARNPYRDQPEEEIDWSLPELPENIRAATIGIEDLRRYAHGR